MFKRAQVIRRLRFASVASGLMLLGGWLTLGCLGNQLVRRELKRVPRDPVTGVVIGQDAIDIAAAPEKLQPGRAVLMLHGFVGSRSDFADLGQRIAEEGVHVRMIREAGHASSPAELAALGPEQMLGHVRAEYLALRKQYAQVDVVGFSMGGTLATLLASEQDVNRLVLAAPYYEVAYRWYYGLRVETWQRTVGWSMNYVPRLPSFVNCNNEAAHGNIFFYSAIPTKGVDTLFALGESARRPAVLRAIHAPTLMLISPKDEASCPRAAAQAFAELGSGQKQFIAVPERNNHHIFWDYDAEQTKMQVVNFLCSPVL